MSAHVLRVAFLLSALGSLAGATGTSFSSPVNYPVGVSPYEVVVDDFNGDGIPDLVVPSILGNCLDVLLGNGDGTFRAAITYPLRTGPLAASDFNQDGKLDLLVTGSNGTELTVLLGNGDGSFQSAGTVSVEEPPLIVAVGDFNGDGRPDVAVIESSPPLSPKLAILLGDGQGNLQPIASYDMSNNTSSLAVTDLNGDRRQDLVIVAGRQVGVFLGNGDGTFQQIQNPPAVTGNLVDSVGAGDFNGDGKLDLIVASRQVCIALLCPLYVELLKGLGDGTFQVPSLITNLNAFRGGPFVVADLNRDGKADAVLDSRGDLGGTLTVLFGNGDGTFQGPLNLVVDMNPVSPVAADLNGDKFPDLVVADINSTDGQHYNLSVLLNTPGSAVFSLSIAVDGNGRVLIPGSPPCADVCSESFASGTEVTLTESPDHGYSFSGWGGACSGTGPCSVVMSSDQSVRASFNAQPDFSLTASALTPNTVTAGQSASGTVTVAPIGGFNSPVAFVCSVQPSPLHAPTCAVNQAALGATVAVMTTAPSIARNFSKHSFSFYAVWIPLVGFVIASFPQTWKSNAGARALLMRTMLLCGVTLQLACGGGGDTQVKQFSGGTPSGNYTITVTGTSGSSQHTASFALTVL